MFKNTLHTLPLLIVGLFVTFLAAACAERPETTDEEAPTADAITPQDTAATTGKKTIVDVLRSNEQFSTLVQALQSANLLDVLRREGSFTVFAPTNAAFTALPQQQRQRLLSGSDTGPLLNVLTYHVVEGRTLTASTLRDSSSFTTLHGDAPEVTQQNGSLMIGNARIVEHDRSASNGILHGIDAVLMPPDSSPEM